MPYARNSELPEAVRAALPNDAQTRFRTVVNSALERKLSEEKSFASAWSVIHNGWKKPEGEGKWIRKAISRTLYVRRDVVNADEIIKWAKGQGFKTTLPDDDMHVTVCFSKQPFDWMKIPDPYPAMEDDEGSLTVRAIPVRALEEFGEGAIVLMFNSYMLEARHADFKQAGASWDHEEYQPHITITYDRGDVDLATVKPYTGEIVLGPEIFEEVKENWKDGIVEKFEKATICKVDTDLGLVFGWAIVCKEDGEDYYDVQEDHIPEDAMLKATTDFMAGARMAKEMHVGDGRGSILFAWPLTCDIAKAMGITCNRTGLMIAMKPDTPDILEKFRSGEYTGFSIGGEYGERVEVV